MNNTIRFLQYDYYLFFALLTPHIGEQSGKQNLIHTFHTKHEFQIGITLNDSDTLLSPTVNFNICV